MIFSIATSGLQDMRLPQWGRSFWQDPNDGEIFLAYGSGTSEVDFITSSDSGVNWSAPALLFPVEDFDVHNNFDITMDRSGHIHCGFRFNGSGCYQFVGKVSGGGWTRASGIGPVGLVAAGDADPHARGFQGSLTMQEAAFASELAGISFPAVKMVVKDSSNDMTTAVLGTPYNVAPSLDALQFGDIAVGASGGFPLIYVAEISSLPTSYVTYYDSEDNSLKTWHRDFGGWFGVDTTKTLSSNEAPFGPSMAIGSGIGFAGNAGIAFACSSGIQADDGSIIGQTIYSHVDNTALTSLYHNIFDISNGTENSWIAKAGLIGGPGGAPVASGNFIQNSGVIPTGNIYGVGENRFSPPGVTIHPFPGQGTNCDFSFNDNGEFLFYWIGKNEWGKQAIGRTKATFDNTSWVLNSEGSIKYPAEVSKTTTGGYSNMLFWGGFKALKHPTEPNGTGEKAEFLVTQGHLPIYPSGGVLTVWDVAKSPALNTWNVGQWSKDYISTSGATTEIEVFKGITTLQNFQFTSHVERTPWMFDDDATSGSEYGLIRDGYTIELELDSVRTIDRFEILHRNLISTPAPGVAISGSVDGVVWSRVMHAPSGVISGTNSYNRGNSLVKYMGHKPTETELANTDPNKPSQSPVAGALQPSNIMDPFAAKLIRLQFENTHKGSHRVYEIRLYGPAHSSKEIVTWSDNSDDPPQFNKLFLTGDGVTTQNFRRQQGTLPPGWRTYGDFEWAVVGSGEATKTSSFKPTDPLPFDYDGKVPSGLWSVTTVGNFRGAGDSFSIRSEAIGDASGLGNPLRTVPVGGIQPGMTAVLEVDINVLQEEKLPRVGTALPVIGRQIGFNIRSDIHFDDVIEFYINGVLQETYLDIGWNTFESYTLGVDKFVSREAFNTTGVGAKTLRWIYRKGAYDPVVSTNVYPFGAAWIDNITGLDGQSVEGSPSNHRLGFIRGVNPFEFSSIHGYASVSDSGISSIHAYASGSPSAESIRKGFLQSRAGQPDQFIHGYASGLGFVSTSINAYMPVFTSGTNSFVNGYLIAGFGSGDNVGQGVIHGFMQSRFGLGNQVIHGFVERDEYTNSSIKGFLPGNLGVFGLGPSQKAIYGYLTTPTSSGFMSTHGYLLGNFPIESIYGYLGSEALVASGGGLVGNPSTSNVVPGVNFLHGYMKGFQGGQMIHGYLKRPLAAFSSIHGYVLAGKDETQIHGYLQAIENPTETIHAYISGVGFESSSINGYVFGVSGIISEKIHGYMSSVELPNSKILGTIIGSIPTSGVCLAHNFPLCPLPSFTLPSGFIN